MASLYQTYKTVVGKWLGKPVDFDGAYANQCVDWVKMYAKDLGYPITTSGNAKEFITKGLGKQWKKVVGEPWEGDIIVFPTGTYGHIAVVSGKARLGFISVIDQNADGKAFKGNNKNNLGAPVKNSKYRLKGNEVYFRVNS